MHLTKRAIIEASNLPISIIIGMFQFLYFIFLMIFFSKYVYFHCLVGVGDADFEAMNELDSDDTRLTVDDLFAERDIVQFVPLNKFLSTSGTGIKCQADLAEEVLAEIPDQLTSFMKLRGMKPDIPANLPQNPSTIMPTAPMD